MVQGRRELGLSPDTPVQKKLFADLLANSFFIVLSHGLRNANQPALFSPSLHILPRWVYWQRPLSQIQCPGRAAVLFPGVSGCRSAGILKVCSGQVVRPGQASIRRRRCPFPPSNSRCTGIYSCLSRPGLSGRTPRSGLPRCGSKAAS